VAAVSRKGAQGRDAADARDGPRPWGVDARRPRPNIEGGVDYLSRMMRRFGADLTKALAAYNAGPEAVER